VGEFRFLTSILLIGKTLTGKKKTTINGQNRVEKQIDSEWVSALLFLG
jgi:hypothetical protein